MLMTNKEYNGWTNYETWNVKLWMDNDEGSSRFNQERAEQVFDAAEADKYFTKSERAMLTLSDALKDDYENNMADLLKAANAECSVWSDLMGAALSEVNWHEIAKHLIEEVEKEVA